MSWLRDEIWFDVDVTWSGEAVGGSQGSVSALQLPLFRRLASEALEPVHAPNGLSASRQRRAERRRRRHARRARAAALVVAPAAVLPLAGQKLGLGGSGSGALQQDPPSLVGGTLPGLPTGDVSAPRAAGAASGPVAGQKTSSQTGAQKIHWHRATSHGLPYGGSLRSGLGHLEPGRGQRPECAGSSLRPRADDPSAHRSPRGLPRRQSRRCTSRRR
jgi:hypothetical protein